MVASSTGPSLTPGEVRLGPPVEFGGGVNEERPPFQNLEKMMLIICTYKMIADNSGSTFLTKNIYNIHKMTDFE